MLWAFLRIFGYAGGDKKTQKIGILGKNREKDENP